jgi:alpha-glucosidase
MQWNNDTNAGFSTHTETWLPVASNYKELNVKAQEGKEKSHLEIYKRLMLLRKHNALKFSEKFGIKTLGTNSFGFTR